jgi:hypothetical protein
MGRASSAPITIAIVLRKSRSMPGVWIGQVPILGVQGHGHTDAEATLAAKLAAVKQLGLLMELALEEPAIGEVAPWSPLVRHLVRVGFDALHKMLVGAGRLPAPLDDFFTVSTNDKDSN